MPTPSAWAVRLSLLHFAAGTGLGALLLAGKAVPLAPWLWALRPAHVEMLLVGFGVQFGVGVATWILPRTPASSGGRSSGAALVLLNAGVLLTVVDSLPGLGGLTVLGRIAETAAAVTFVVAVVPRVRAVRGDARR